MACMIFWTILAGCAQLGTLQNEMGRAQDDADADGDGWTVSQGDCNEDCSGKIILPDGAVVCIGWVFHPMEDDELEQKSLGPTLDQDCDGVTDGQQPGLDFDGDGFAGVPHAGEIRDCDDEDRSVRPGAPETCGDGIDNDCDGRDLPCEEE